MSVANDDLRVVVSPSEHHVCISIEGELDVASAPLFDDILHAAMESGVGDVVVDMSRTAFCNSAGLAVLRAAQRQLHLAGRQLCIVHPSRPVRRLLDLSGTRSLAGSHPPPTPPPARGRLPATVERRAEPS